MQLSTRGGRRRAGDWLSATSFDKRRDERLSHANIRVAVVIRRRAEFLVEANQLSHGIDEVGRPEVQRDKRQRGNSIALQLKLLACLPIMALPRLFQLAPEKVVPNFMGPDRLDLESREKAECRPGYQKDRSVIQPYHGLRHVNHCDIEHLLALVVNENGT